MYLSWHSHLDVSKKTKKKKKVGSGLSLVMAAAKLKERKLNFNHPATTRTFLGVFALNMLFLFGFLKMHNQWHQVYVYIIRLLCIVDNVLVHFLDRCRTVQHVLSSYVPQSKDMQGRLGELKTVILGVAVIAWDCFSLCISPLIN